MTDSTAHIIDIGAPALVAGNFIIHLTPKWRAPYALVFSRPVLGIKKRSTIAMSAVGMYASRHVSNVPEIGGRSNVNALHVAGVCTARPASSMPVFYNKLTQLVANGIAVMPVVAMPRAQ